MLPSNPSQPWQLKKTNGSVLYRTFIVKPSCCTYNSKCCHPCVSSGSDASRTQLEHSPFLVYSTMQPSPNAIARFQNSYVTWAIHFVQKTISRRQSWNSSTKNCEFTTGKFTNHGSHDEVITEWVLHNSCKSCHYKFRWTVDSRTGGFKKTYKVTLSHMRIILVFFQKNTSVHALNVRTLPWLV